MKTLLEVSHYLKNILIMLRECLCAIYLTFIYPYLHMALNFGGELATNICKTS